MVWFAPDAFALEPNGGSSPNLLRQQAVTTTAVTTLYGNIEYNDFPDVQSFEAQVLADRDISCDTKKAIRRLVRIADNDSQRMVVWHRMISQELIWASNRELSHIEEIAQACNMPLVRQ